MLESPRRGVRQAEARGTFVKKGVVLLLIVLALIVLVSPGLIGRLAEERLDEGIRTGTVETEDVVVSAEFFDRGWFTTEGQHRVEFRDGRIAEQYRDLFGLPPDADLPVVIISTRVDHGLIPVASMGREDGSLMPGLGDAISTVQIEMPDGRTVDLPGVINSKITLTGSMVSEYELVEGAIDDLGDGVRWGNGKLRVATAPGGRKVAVKGTLTRLELTGSTEPLVIRDIAFDAEQQPSPYGIPLGEAHVVIQSISSDRPDSGPFDIYSRMAEEDDGLRIDVALDVASMAPPFGELGTVLELSASKLDPEHFGAFIRKYQALSGLVADPATLQSMIEPEAQALMASGLSLEIPRLDLSTPDGTFESTLTLDVAPVDADGFTWTSLLLATQANANARVSDALLDTLIALTPEAGALVGMGYLKREGDDYVTEVRYAKGILTINGAPLTIPLPAP